MSSLTISGVCYDVARSPFVSVYKGITFKFSSEAHMNKFESKCNIRIEWMNDSLSRRFHFNVDASLIAVFQLYCQVETRGFCVILADGTELRSKEELWLTSSVQPKALT